MDSLKHVVRQMVQYQDGVAACGLCLALLRCGMRYYDVYEFVNGITGVSLADWDELLADGDYELGR